jgi:signal transduction histidine kinase
MDLIFIKSSNLIYYVDVVSILLTITILVAFFFRAFSINTVVKLQILVFLANIIACSFINPLNAPGFVSSFLRNTILLFMLIPVYGLFSGKKQLFIIGLIYILLYIETLFRANNPILNRNAPVIIFGAVLYMVAFYYIFDTIERMHIYQVQLNDRLTKQKEQAEVQKANIERLYAELKDSNQKLTESNQTKDKLFSIIAHDLRSPFNNILGISEILVKNVEDFKLEESKMYLELISVSAKNTLILLDNLLNWSKSQTGQIIFTPRKTDLAAVIQEIIKQSESAANRKKISLTQIQQEDIIVSTDENMVKTILRNLVSNAIKFTETGGNVTISAVTEQNRIKITVSDNGIGIPEETRKKLFGISANISTSGTANEGGSGLGLILCRDFAKLLGGEISVASEPGKGSDFKFTIPYPDPNNL